MNKNLQIILGSSSERRKMIFSMVFDSYKILIPLCEEKIFKNPQKTALENAKLKLFSVLQQFDSITEYDSYIDKMNAPTLIVTADTIVYKNKIIYPKPKDKNDAFSILKELNGEKHSVFSGIYLCYINNMTKKFYHFCEKTDVYFNFFSDNVLKNYIDSGEPMDAAGSYKIQGKGSIFVKKVKGSLTNVIGFPIEKFLKYYNRFIC